MFLVIDSKFKRTLLGTSIGGKSEVHRAEKFLLDCRLLDPKDHAPEIPHYISRAGVDLTQIWTYRKMEATQGHPGDCFDVGSSFPQGYSPFSRHTHTHIKLHHIQGTY